jgi:hypothetical protein
MIRSSINIFNLLSHSQLLEYQYWLCMSHLKVLVPGAGCKLNKLDFLVQLLT